MKKNIPLDQDGLIKQLKFIIHQFLVHLIINQVINKIHMFMLGVFMEVIIHQLNWIDNQRRAVIVQLSLYNPNVGLFISVTFLIEFFSTGVIYTTSGFELFDFSFLIECDVCFILGFTSKVQLICIIVYMIFIIYFILNEFRLLIELKESHIRQF